MNEQKLFSYTALIDFFNRAGVRSLRGRVECLNLIWLTSVFNTLINIFPSAYTLVAETIG